MDAALATTVFALAGFRQAIARRLDRALPSLASAHPEARNGSRVNLGVQTIPVASIAGTAVEGDTQRNRDFLPVSALRTAGWRSRWQRLQKAGQDMAVLPPIEVDQVGDHYWVVDGHHRVALALTLGQWYIDADVTVVRWLGGPRASATETPDLSSVLAAAVGFRAAIA